MNINLAYVPMGTTQPNQKFGTIHKKNYKDEGMKFMYVGIEEIRNAAKNLTPSAFKLYLYFAENADDWKFSLSFNDFNQAYGVAESTYRKAKQELIDKGYIVEREHNNFDFYTDPSDAVSDLKTIQEEMTVLLGRIDEYDNKITEDFLSKIRTISALQGKEKERRAIEILKEMRKTLDGLYKTNSKFKIDF